MMRHAIFLTMAFDILVSSVPVCEWLCIWICACSVERDAQEACLLMLFSGPYLSAAVMSLSSRCYLGTQRDHVINACACSPI